VVCSDSTRRGDRGVTVTEMVVATLLLATAILAAASMLGGASTASAVGANRQAAIGLAASELDVMRSLRFDAVAIPSTAPGFVTRFEDRVTVADARGGLVPTSTVQRRGVDMVVRRMVTWASVRTRAGVEAEAYKHLTVIVEWTDTAGPHSHRLDTALFDPASVLP
jgi:Tfp pilus assembly protein PilV